MGGEKGKWKKELKKMRPKSATAQLYFCEKEHWICSYWSTISKNMHERSIRVKGFLPLFFSPPLNSLYQFLTE